MKNQIILVSLVIHICSMHFIFSQDFNVGKGGLIDGPANVREEPNGKLLFELYNNTVVTATEVRSDWLRVGIYLKIDEHSRDGNFIKPNNYLVNEQGDTVGYTHKKVSIGLNTENHGFIHGYTHKLNIQPNTIPENILSDLLNENKICKSDFNVFINDYNFNKYVVVERLLKEGGINLQALFISDTIIDDITPHDRITLLFEEDQLKGFVHSRKVDVVEAKTVDLIRGHSLTVLDRCMDEMYFNKIRDTFIYFYSTSD